MLLTQYEGMILGPIAKVLGWIMNAIFWLLSQIGLDNIGLCIILFTIVIYILLMPLTIKQQRFSKLQSRMNPELQAIQKKYKGKEQDQTVMMKMNEETKAVYDKYGVSPMGSCVQLLIQMPVLFALYRVIWNIPAYVTKVRDAFMPLAEAIVKTAGAEEVMSEMAGSVTVSFKEMTNLTVIDVLYKLAPSHWTQLAEKFPELSDLIASTQAEADHMNYFLGLNIADSPSSIISSAVAAGAWLLVIGAVLIPVLSAVTQWVNTKLMPQTTEENPNAKKSDTEATMATTMKTMNTMMPLMSAVFCFTLPVGMGIYWIAGSVVRSIQQVIVNKQIDKLDIDELVKKNLEKINKKREKQGLPPQKMTTTAKINTRTIETPVKKQISEEERKQKIEKSTEYYKNTSTAKPGSLASKAQMVQQYNERNMKKKK